MKIEYPPGATPLDPDEAKGLKVTYVSTLAELNALEQENVLAARLWLTGRGGRGDPLDEKFLRDLHRAMFGDVWKWAGQFRRSDKNIGCAWQQIPVLLRQLLENTRYWVERSTYAWDEIGVRFHHRLVSVHCFANGNGRHARLAADVLMEMNGQAAFTWGASDLVFAGDGRREYIEALRLADQGTLDGLLAFARS